MFLCTYFHFHILNRNRDDKRVGIEIIVIINIIDFTQWNFIVCIVHLTGKVIKSRRLRWAGHVARMEGGRSVFKILTSTPTGKRPLERLRHRWEDNIRMGLKEMGINTRNWVD